MNNLKIRINEDKYEVIYFNDNIKDILENTNIINEIDINEYNKDKDLYIKNKIEIISNEKMSKKVYLIKTNNKKEKGKYKSGHFISYTEQLALMSAIEYNKDFENIRNIKLVNANIKNIPNDIVVLQTVKY